MEKSRKRAGGFIQIFRPWAGIKVLAVFGEKLFQNGLLFGDIIYSVEQWLKPI